MFSNTTAPSVYCLLFASRKLQFVAFETEECFFSLRAFSTAILPFTDVGNRNYVWKIHMHSRHNGWKSKLCVFTRVTVMAYSRILRF